jgi:hypothetical protein
MTGERRARAFPWAALAAAALAALGIASIRYTLLALAAGFLTLLGGLVLPRRAPAGSQRRVLQLLIATAGISSAIGFVRFVVLEATPGIVQGGRAATAGHAVSRLRQILFAEDAMRKTAALDPDGDGIGSAALIGELTGAEPLRNGARLDPPILSPAHYAKLDETPLGRAALVSGYYFIVCLPTPSGDWTARSGEPVDEELAERRFVAYAWPAAAGAGPHEVYFLDQHETILVHGNVDAGAPRFVGPHFPPPCDSALREPEGWRPWRGKTPRTELPGDRR